MNVKFTGSGVTSGISSKSSDTDSESEKSSHDDILSESDIKSGTCRSGCSSNQLTNTSADGESPELPG